MNARSADTKIADQTAQPTAGTVHAIRTVTDLDQGADLAVEAQRPINAYVEDQDRAYVFFPSRVWRQLHGVQAWRETPVRHLKPEECRKLLYHFHGPSEERRKAYMLVSAGGHPEIYFDENAQEKINTWMAREAVRNNS